MSIRAHVVVQTRGVDAHLEVESGKTLALMGPNGAGKSTVLEAIAGLVVMTAGVLEVGNREIYGSGRTVPARDRGIGLLTQDDLLFPTMTVRQNVAFGPRARGASKQRALAVADEWLERVGLHHVGAQSPASLSSGQARRVALARALAGEPEALLLDEPFGGLDVESASHVRALLATLLDGVTAIVTTHDALDAHSLAHHVAVMAGGTVVEQGPADSVLATPRTAFAARMAGRILVEGIMRGGALELATGDCIPVRGNVPNGTRAAIALRPSLIPLLPDKSTVHYAWVEDTVVAVEPRGDYVRVHGSLAAADVDVASAGQLRLGERITIGIPPHLTAYAL